MSKIDCTFFRINKGGRAEIDEQHLAQVRPDAMVEFGAAQFGGGKSSPSLNSQPSHAFTGIDRGSGPRS